MNKSGGKRGRGNLGRKSKSTFVTKSGQTIRINRSIGDKLRAKHASYAQKRAERLAGMPKGRLQRVLYRLQPKRLYRYWFSREGAIMALKLFGIGALVTFLLLVGIFAYFRKDLPNIRDISGNNIGGSILYYDRTGQTLLFEDVNGSKRIPVKDEAISPSIKQATIAIEDKDFFKHGGFDLRGIIRAGFNNVFGHGGTQGGSTISQQLVRLTQTNIGKEQTYKRKIKEIILSVELEREYSKQEILTGYLNAAPYGGIENGVEAASQDYFHKSAKDLTLEQAAMLAAIPKSPTYYSPYNKTNFEKDALIGRQRYILDLMEQQHMITSKQRDDAKKVAVLAEVQDRPQHYDNIKAPWFVLTAKEELERIKGANSVKLGGWKVTTTLDLNAQNIAEQQVQKGLPQVRRQGGDTAAFVAEDVKTGQVVALVGGDNFNEPDHGEFNYARTELPPGSSFKPYDYTALIDTQKNVGAGSVLYDSNGAIPGYPCTTGIKGNCVHDYDFRFPGPETLRYALGGSRNVPAIKAMLIAGVDQTIDVAHKLMTNYGDDGKPDPTIGNYRCYYDAQNTQQSPCYASSAIGDGAYLRLDEHVHGYATLSRNGLNIPKTYILKVQDSAGKTLSEWKPSKGFQAVSPETAYIVDDMISDPNPSYFPGGNKPQRYKGWKFGVKTGTTNDSKDGLMMMMSTQYAAGVWVGYHNRQRVMSGFMEVMTQPIVGGWMKAMHDPLTPVDRVKPSGLQTLPAFIVRSHVGNGSVEPSTATDLFPSWYKQPGKASGANQNIDTVSNKLATECTPQRAIKQVSNADSNTFSVDKFVGGGAAAGTTQEKDDVHKCDDAKPAVSLTQSGNTLTASVVAGTHPLSSDQFPGTVNFMVDGQVVYSAPVSNDNPTATYTFDQNFSGDKTFTAQVIDSVLYDGSSNGVTVTGTGGTPSPLVINLTVTNTTGSTFKFNWNTVTGASSYQICIKTSSTPAFVCTVGNPGDTRTVTGTGRKAYVTSDNSVQSNTVDF
ncbi:MAG TPA: transglycosylase domain-containing protein [Candidatus Saccharimonadales bacterium]|nr:transglycosylase domain-containing protein [Candidatus Saccharimonadales bacterium]